MHLSPDKKIAGVLAPLFGLRSGNDLGIGDVAVLREFIDWAAEIGFKLVQLLPIDEMGGDNSPYNAISAIAIEPTTLHLAPGSPEDLMREDYEAALVHVDLTKLRHGAVKYGPVKRLKRLLLEKAFENFSAHASEDRSAAFAKGQSGPDLRRDRQSAFEKFCAEEKNWLDDYMFFRALMEQNGESEAWDKWPREHQHIESARAWLDQQSPEKKKQFHQREDFFRYVQWIAHEQWTEVKRYAEGHQVALSGKVEQYLGKIVFNTPDIEPLTREPRVAKLRRAHIMGIEHAAIHAGINAAARADE